MAEVDTTTPQIIAEATVQQLRAPIGAHATPDQKRAAEKRKAAIVASGGVEAPQEHPSDSDKAVRRHEATEPAPMLKDDDQPEETFAAPDPNPPKAARRRGGHDAR